MVREAILKKGRGYDRALRDSLSYNDFLNLKIAGPLPIAFLRGVGRPDNLKGIFTWTTQALRTSCSGRFLTQSLTI